MVMTAEKATKLGHDQVTRLCRRFVDIQQSFSCIFRRRDGNHFCQFGEPELNETQGYATVATNYSLFYSLRRCKSLSRGLPFQCMSPELNKVWFSR